MNSPDQDWWIAQSGEYVLGTLSHADWITFKKAAEHDAHAQQLIAEWEQTFQPLADALEPVTPPESVWVNVAARIAAGDHLNDSSNVASIENYHSTAKNLQKKLDQWRSYAGLATAASILVASLAWVNYTDVQDVAPIEPTVVTTQFDAMTIIRNEQSLPLWVVDTALADGLVRVTSIAPPVIDASQSYELWLVKPDNAGVQSMGLIPVDSDQSLLVKVQAEANNPVAFAVSLEPAGGSPEDAPTGPVLYQGVVQQLSL